MYCWRCDFSLSLASIFEYLTPQRGYNVQIESPVIVESSYYRSENGLLAYAITCVLNRTLQAAPAETLTYIFFGSVFATTKEYQTNKICQRNSLLK